MAMQEFLQEATGIAIASKTALGVNLSQYRGQEKGAKNGCDVVLTVDLGLKQSSSKN